MAFWHRSKVYILLMLSLGSSLIYLLLISALCQFFYTHINIENFPQTTIQEQPTFDAVNVKSTVSEVHQQPAVVHKHVENVPQAKVTQTQGERRSIENLQFLSRRARREFMDPFPNSFYIRLVKTDVNIVCAELRKIFGSFHTSRNLCRSRPVARVIVEIF